MSVWCFLFLGLGSLTSDMAAFQAQGRSMGVSNFTGLATAESAAFFQEHPQATPQESADVSEEAVLVKPRVIDNMEVPLGVMLASFENPLFRIWGPTFKNKLSAVFGKRPRGQRYVFRIVFRPDGLPLVVTGHSSTGEEARALFESMLRQGGNWQTLGMDIPLDFAILYGEFEDPWEGMPSYFQAVDDAFARMTPQDQITHLQTWARRQVLPTAGAICEQIGENHKWIRKTGQLFKKLPNEGPIDVTRFDKSMAFWSSQLAFFFGQPASATGRIMMDLVNGKVDEAFTKAYLLGKYCDPNAFSGFVIERFLNLMLAHKEPQYEALNRWQGLLVEGDLQSGLDLVNSVTETYPHSAMAWFFKTRNLKYLKLGGAGAAEKRTYANDALFPLFNVLPKLSGVDFGRRDVLLSYFKEGDDPVTDTVSTAKVMLDLGHPEIAAMLFAQVYKMDVDNNLEARNHFLYSVEQLGVKKLKKSIDENFKPIFKRLKQESDQRMAAYR